MVRRNRGGGKGVNIMQINIKLSKNFTTQWNKLQAEFGD